MGSSPELASRGVRSSVMRLPPTNHGDGDNGFMATIVGIARDKGVSGYIGDGSNRWPAVHRLDTARLYRLALEKAPAGSTLHAVPQAVAAGFALLAGLTGCTVGPKYHAPAPPQIVSLYW